MQKLKPLQPKMNQEKRGEETSDEAESEEVRTGSKMNGNVEEVARNSSWAWGSLNGRRG